MNTIDWNNVVLSIIGLILIGMFISAMSQIQEPYNKSEALLKLQGEIHRDAGGEVAFAQMCQIKNTMRLEDVPEEVRQLLKDC